MNDDELVCTEEIHHHGCGDFGEGEFSTSHMENTWAQMKTKIKSIYNIIPKKYFKKILKKIYLLHEFNFYT